MQTKQHVPLLRPGLVSRPRLIEKLNGVLWENGGFACKLSLITAPAGFGKTTLTADWIRQLDLATAWLSLDADDNEPERFLSYLAAVMQGAGINWQPTTTEPEPMTGLINMLTVAHPLVLVLDDYHLISNTAVHRHITFLLEHAPPNFHLVLNSRADPPLPLPRLRARSELNEVRMPDLLFTDEETAALLNQINQLNLPATDLQALNTRTEGWAAGLQLAVLSLQRLAERDRHQFITDFAGDDRYILDYLFTEVLQQQSAARKTFLLHTSVLEELNADLCAAVTASSRADMQAMLQALEQDNLFLIPLDNRRERYRYHRLFADLLRSRLTGQLPEAIAIIHQRASHWFAAHDRLDAAIQHSLAAGDMAQAAKLLESEALLRHATPGQILAWLAQLPDAVQREHPRLAIMQLWVLLESGQLDEVEARLQQLAQSATADPELALEYLVIQVHLARHRHDSGQAIALSRDLLAQLPSPPTPQSLPQQLGAVFGLAEAYRLAGDLAAARTQFTEADRLSQLAGSSDFRLRAQLGLAHLLVMEGVWSTAVSALQVILSEAEPDFPLIADQARRLLSQAPPTLSLTGDTLPEPLTEREQDVLRWLDSELSTAEIGQQLFISPNTVKTHLKRIYAKLGARGRHEAIAIARERHLL